MLALALRLGTTCTGALLGLVLLAAATGQFFPAPQLAYESRLSRDNYELYLLDVRARVALRLTRTPYGERHPAFDPAGTALAFAANPTGTWELYRLALADLNAPPERLTFDQSGATHPTWQPDGTALVYNSNRHGNLELYRTPVQSPLPPGPPQRLTFIVGADREPTYAPDGTRLAFTAFRDNDMDIFQYNFNAHRATSITTSPELNEWAPAWSPDGHTLTYTVAGATGWEIFRQDMTDPDAKPVQMTDLPSDASGAVWSPDGRWLAFEMYDTVGARSLYLMPAGARMARLHDLRRLSAGASDDRYVDWRPGH